MDRLNYHHLFYFFTVAREGSIARASARLGLAQPTVSAQIHALEDELGRKLLERNGRGLKITPEGETVLRFAASIFAMGGELVAALDGQQGAQPVLPAGVSASMPPALVSALTSGISRLSTRPRLMIVEEAPEALAVKVASGELQFALSDTPLPRAAARGLHSRALLQCPIALFAPAALARRWSRDVPARLSGTGVAIRSDGPLREEVERWLAKSKLAVEIVAEMPNPEFYAVSAGAGVFAPLLLKDWLRTTHGLAMAGELKGSQWRVSLVTAKNGRKRPAVAAVVAAAKVLG